MPDQDYFNRQFVRYALRFRAHLVQDGFEIPCMTQDISAGGARVKYDPISQNSIKRTSRTVIEIDHLGRYPGKLVWQDSVYIGVAFQLSHSVQSNLDNALRTLHANPPALSLF